MFSSQLLVRGQVSSCSSATLAVWPLQLSCFPHSSWSEKKHPLDLQPNLLHMTFLTQPLSYNLPHSTSLTQPPSHNLPHNLPQQPPSLNLPHTISLIQPPSQPHTTSLIHLPYTQPPSHNSPSHNLPHTTSLTQPPSHNSPSSTSLTQPPSHNLPHTSLPHLSKPTDYWLHHRT